MPVLQERKPVFIDIPDFQVQCLPQTQAHTVGHQNKRLVAKFTRAINYTLNLLHAEDVGQYPCFGWLDDIDPDPFPIQHVLVEELQTVAVDLYCTPGVALHQGGEIVLEMRLIEAIGTAVEELSDTPYGSGVGIDGVRGLALAFQCVNMVFVQ